MLDLGVQSTHSSMASELHRKSSDMNQFCTALGIIGSSDPSKVGSAVQVASTRLACESRINSHGFKGNV